MGDKREPTGTTWGTYLRSARNAKGLSQEKLAELSSVDRKTISRWENGRVAGEPDKLIAVAAVLGIPASDALAVANDVTDTPLPPPLPGPLAHLVELYAAMDDPDRAALLERVDWVNEWAETRVNQGNPRRRRRTG